MATDVASMPVNGNYAPHQGYGGIEHGNNYAYSNNNVTSLPAVQPPPSSTTPATNTTGPQPAATTQKADIDKNEVGWYFVEQYYTTLSRTPDKLHLFYNKRSQFVSGQETDKVSVCVGQKAVEARIKELDFKDAKVLVTNVDSQASDEHIVIQVIGAISNRSQPHRKFTQTFVLATQTNGYFVLNDIFRYIIEEEDEPEPEAESATEEVQQAPAAESGYLEPVPTATGEEEPEPKTLTSSKDPAAVEHDAQQVDRELEEKVLDEAPEIEEPSEPTVNGVAAAEPEIEEAEDAPAAVVPEQTTAPEPAPAPAVQEEPEKPVEPESTPAASPPKQATPQPPPAPKPAAPKTWASLAASANRGVATPVTPSTASSNTSQVKPTPPTTTKAATPASAAPASPAPTTAPTAPAAQRDDSPADPSQGDEWTAVGGHNRQQSRQANVQQEGPQNRGYVKNVSESVDFNELRTHLEQYGELTHFDIARQRACAFVDFKTVEGYNAAVSANPHTVSGERLYVEERRIRPGSTPWVPRGNAQGGRGRGGPGQGPPRGGYQARGGAYGPPRGGRGGPGGAPAPRGRGGSAQAPA